MPFDHEHLSRKDREIRGLRIDSVHREDEAGLALKCWFDYQELDPVEKTYIFARHYEQQTRIFYERCVDIGTAEDARAFAPDDIFMSRDLTSMWLARRASDVLGVPYGVTMSFAQGRFLERLFHRFPRPNQLYGEEFEDDLALHWKKLLSEGVRYSSEPRFKVANWKNGSPTLAQARHRNFIVQQIKTRPRPHHRILGRMFAEGVLSVPTCHRLFTDAELDLAEDVAARLSHC